MMRYQRNKAVQDIAKETIAYLSSIIIPGITERDIKVSAENFMIKQGIESFWYYDVGALVFTGHRTLLSISGKDYSPSDVKVHQEDVVTVDLSPCIGNSWGDYSRTFIIGSRNNCREISFLNHLHSLLCSSVKTSITFHELYLIINEEITSCGFENLDFKSNLGHTIENDINKRIYIEKNCNTRINDVELFTFEPHIRSAGGQYGFKMENIYFMTGNNLTEL
ncbi:MAG: aminopeptidase P family protein [Spirochaetes bacterium]|nr:aminopeptidase P family protein [Spirochaetota bacterium]